MIKEYMQWFCGGLCAALGFAELVKFLRKNQKPIPCDSCQYLLRKDGGGYFKYECASPGRYIIDSFDKPPKYCRSYKTRDNNNTL